MKRVYQYRLYRQNNSGGFYIVNDRIAEYVIIRACSDAQAERIAESIGLYNLSFCPCCGVRFYSNGYNGIYDTLEQAIESIGKYGGEYRLHTERTVKTDK